MENKTRILLIQKLIDFNEKIFFYPKLKSAYKKLIKKKSPVILDVGSNKGQTIDFFLKLFPSAKITGFEPNNRLFELLEKRYKKNTDIRIIRKGVSNIDGNKMFYENVLDETSSLEELNYESDYLKMKARVLGLNDVHDIIKQSYEIEICTLAGFLRSEQINVIDVLKIDVEGHELSCLQGLFNEKLNTQINWIQLENHQDDMYSGTKYEEIKKLIESQGFYERIKIKHGFGNFFEIIYENKSII